jgi:hypothetical protein
MFWLLPYISKDVISPNLNPALNWKKLLWVHATQFFHYAAWLDLWIINQAHPLCQSGERALFRDLMNTGNNAIHKVPYEHIKSACIHTCKDQSMRTRSTIIFHVGFKEEVKVNVAPIV